jgi:hypothetical protein
MAESTVVYTPENGGNIPAWMAMNNGGLFGNNGWGGGILGFLLGLFFGNGWGGFGGFGGNNGGAGFLSNQINNDSGRELLMNAITSQGEAGRAATQNLATMLGQDYNQVSAAVATLQAGLSNLALQQAVSVPQIINSIQSGNSALASQLAQCCCENRLLTTQQGFENRIQTIDQTNTLASAIADLKSSMVDQFCAAKERDMQDKINAQGDLITQLRGQIDNDRQTAQLQAIIAPLQQQVNNIAAKQINTVPVAWPNLQAVNTTPYVNGGFYGSPFGFGNGVTF